MIGCHNALSALTLLFLVTVASFLHLSTPNPISTHGNVNNPQGVTLPQLTMSEDEQGDDEERRTMQKVDEEEELFKDVDPKTLAAVLLEALNRSQVERRNEGEERRGAEEGMPHL